MKLQLIFEEGKDGLKRSIENFENESSLVDTIIEYAQTKENFNILGSKVYDGILEGEVFFENDLNKLAKLNFGNDENEWVMKCPCCGSEYKVSTYKAEGGDMSKINFKCIGNYSEKYGCNYNMVEHDLIDYYILIKEEENDKILVPIFKFGTEENLKNKVEFSI